MKMGKKISIAFIAIFIFLFKIDAVSAAGGTGESFGITKCEYEMYPIGYYHKEGLIGTGENPYEILHIENYNDTIKVIYENNKKLRKISNYEGTGASKFKDSAFHKTVQVTNECPKYVYVKKSTFNISIIPIEKDEFLKKTETFYSGLRTINLPMVLVNQNGNSVTEPSKVLFDSVLKNWNTIINDSEKKFRNSKCPSSIINPKTYGMNETDFFNYIENGYTNRKNEDENISPECWNARYEYVSAIRAANNLNSSIEKSEATSKIVENNSDWSSFYKFAMKFTGIPETMEKLEELEEEQTMANSDYCYYYYDMCVSENGCNQINATAKTECIRAKNLESCNKSKCTEAYDNCKHIGSDASKTECLKKRLSENGGYDNYTIARDQEMAELTQELEKLRKSIETARISNINIEVGVHPYKLTCDDVAIFHDIWVIFIILAPVLTILMGVLDFGQAVISSNEDKIKKAWARFPKRVFALIILLLVPLLISLLLSLTTDEGARDTSLMNCIINGGE